MNGKAEKYEKLVGATVEYPALNSVEVSVTLTTHPPHSARVWFPLAHFEEHADGSLYAARWLIDKKNQELRKQGETATIQIDPEGGFYV